jgi:predicted RecB family nuclease
MRILISRQLFSDFLCCKYKAYLRAQGVQGYRSEYEDVNDMLLAEYRSRAQQRLLASHPAGKTLDASKLSTKAFASGIPVLTDVTATVGNLSVQFDAIVRSTTNPSHTAAYYPMLFMPSERISAQDKFVLALYGTILARLGLPPPRFGTIIHGRDYVETRIRFNSLTASVESLLDEIVDQLEGSSTPRFRLNKHCSICGFKEHCKKLACEKDDLSLLRGLSEKEITKLNKRGIFTTNQLSYTFRPRRRRKNQSNLRPPKHQHSLQALAVHTDKIYVAERPVLPKAPTRIYVDIEGIPDSDFFYLIGVHIGGDGRDEQISLWANDEETESLIWHSFLRILQSKIDVAVFHYGAYDANAFTLMQAKYGGDQEAIQKLNTSRVNVLSLIYGNVYFPSFSNDLKSVATSLGFEWSDEDPSGINSIAWRHLWERGRGDYYKRKLITYNREDCAALKVVTEALYEITVPEPKLSKEKHRETVDVQSLARGWPNIYKRNEFFYPVLKRINECAYFDYQRERILVRTSPDVRAAVRQERKKNRLSKKVNQEIVCLRPRHCPICFSENVFRHGSISKTVHDLRFLEGGIRRWNIKYIGQRYICTRCGSTFLPEGYPASKYGSNLRAWVVYQCISQLKSQKDIVEEMQEIFGECYATAVVAKFKSSAANYYETTFQEILTRIREGEIAHVDETKVSIKGRAGYVWVFTNLQEVAYVYSPTREGDTLREVLYGFKGVLISDFFAAYDSLDCKHQRCLIHLIRDINDDLFKHPWDDDLKQLSRDFTSMLAPIIETIDKYGLKKRYLKKHCGYAKDFQENISGQQYSSEVARSYQQRFNRHKDKLFTFLSHDGVPWNNNNAENAVKRFAFMRRVIGGSCTEKGIKEYLVLLSVQETLRRRSESFLKFMLTKRTSLDAV